MTKRRFIIGTSVQVAVGCVLLWMVAYLTGHVIELRPAWFIEICAVIGIGLPLVAGVVSDWREFRRDA